MLTIDYFEYSNEALMGATMYSTGDYFVVSANDSCSYMYMYVCMYRCVCVYWIYMYMLRPDSQPSPYQGLPSCFEMDQPDEITACFQVGWLDGFETGWVDANVVVTDQLICRSAVALSSPRQ